MNGRQSIRVVSELTEPKQCQFIIFPFDRFLLIFAAQNKFWLSKWWL
jgi:hypothetical protein